MAAIGDGPAERLIGQTLLDAWYVEARIRIDDGISGASRSACYRARSPSGQPAFVKAFDFRREELAGDTDSLEMMVREFNYERNVHIFCRDSGINRVTRIYGAGKINVNGEVVHFLICEWADKCLREHQPPGDSNVSASDRFAALRDVASALAQLHYAGIAHQDAKPSNAVCPEDGAIMLADLGSSSCQNLDAPPHDSQVLVGQPNYAPYELLYERPPAGWHIRRFGCDLFLLGNLCFTTFTGGSLSYLTLHAIPSQLRPTEFAGEYEEVVPHLVEAHHMLVRHFLEQAVPEPCAEDATRIVLSLCHPDPFRRGHSRNLSANGNPFGLERFISNFDLLAKRAQVLSHGRR